MSNLLKSLATLIMIGGFLTGCISKNAVLFVTKTSLSVLEVDSKPPGASVAYDRVEGYIGPRYENGAVPPVFAAIDSDGKLFNPKINQLYATGHAALLATQEEDNDRKPQEPTAFSGDKKIMFFGTTTTNGLKIGVTNSLPDSFVFGYRRKEYSYIPLGTVDGIDHYPSVLASIQTKGTVGENPLSGNVSLANKQFFATGIAAEHLAVQLRPNFQERAVSAVGAVSDISKCYAGVQSRLRPRVWKKASDANLFFEPQEERGDLYKLLLAAFKTATSNPAEIDLDRLGRVDRAYLSNVIIKGNLKEDPDRPSRLGQHANFVCVLSELNVAPE